MFLRGVLHTRCLAPPACPAAPAGPSALVLIILLPGLTSEMVAETSVSAARAVSLGLDAPWEAGAGGQSAVGMLPRLPVGTRARGCIDDSDHGVDASMPRRLVRLLLCGAPSLPITSTEGSRSQLGNEVGAWPWSLPVPGRGQSSAPVVPSLQVGGTLSARCLTRWACRTEAGVCS